METPTQKPTFPTQTQPNPSPSAGNGSSSATSRFQGNTKTRKPKWFSRKGQQNGTHSSSQNSKQGRSRYARKKRNRGAKPVAAIKLGPVFEYISACCSLPARKPRTGTPKGNFKVGPNGPEKENKKEFHGLGGWRCTGCNKPCSCTRRKPQAPVEVVPVAAA